MKILWILVSSLLAALLLTAFSHIESVVKYAFSLIAFYVAFRFFKKNEEIRTRILFVIIALILYFISSFVYSLLAELNGWPYKRVM